MAVITFNGEFESDFPVTLSGGAEGQALQLHLGDGGSAQVELESFQGTIRLVRPGTVAAHRERDDDDSHAHSHDHDDDDDSSQ